MFPTEDQLYRILYHASLAPSPHNVQGWRFRCNENQLEVLTDPTCRIMYELDPLERERDIALGAVTENIVLAARKEGLRAQVSYPLEDQSIGSTVATIIRFAPLERNLPRMRRDLHHWIEARGMNRSLYTGKPVPPEQLMELKAIALEEGLELHVITQPERISRLADLAGEAGRFKFSHGPTHRELYRYLRFSRAEAAANRDGLPLEHFNIPAWMAQIARIGMGWAVVRCLNVFGYHRALAYVQETMPIRSAPAVCLLRSANGDRIDYLRGGRALQRLWLTAARYGLAVQPHSAVADLSYARQAGYHSSIPPVWQQRIDEFPRRLRELFDVQGELHVVNLFRMGYPTRTWPTRSLRKAVKILQNPVSESSLTNTADDFYQKFTERNTPFISPAEQRLLRESRIGIAGCGSIGGASLEVLTRMGAEEYLLAEPDIFELNNLNRQNATTADIGRHKAHAILQRMLSINSHVRAEVLENGLTAENMAYFVSTSSVIIDGVDVTTPSAIRMKILLHEEAFRQQKVVICGYDIAGTQLLRIYDYCKGKRRPLNGKFVNANLDTMTSLGFLSKVISPLDLPMEMLPVTRGIIDGTLGSIPQLGPTAQLFGVFSAWAALDVLAGRPVRHKVLIDIPGSLRPRIEVWKSSILRVIAVIRLKMYLNRILRKTSHEQSAANTGSTQK